MQHTMMTFSLHRKGVVLLALGAVLLGSLLFVAGCLTGQRRAASLRPGGSGLPRLAAAPAVKAPAVKPPAIKVPALKAPAVKPPALKMPAVPGPAVAAPAVKAAPPAEEVAFALRAGAFADEAEAKTALQELAGRGLQVSLVSVPTSAGTVLHTVLIGRYASREAAAAAAAELARREGLSAVVVAARKAR